MFKREDEVTKHDIRLRKRFKKEIEPLLKIYKAAQEKLPEPRFSFQILDCSEAMRVEILEWWFDRGWTAGSSRQIISYTEQGRLVGYHFDMLCRIYRHYDMEGLGAIDSEELERLSNLHEELFDE